MNAVANATDNFLSALDGHPEVDLSRATRDRWGSIKGIRLYAACTLDLLNSAEGALGIGNIAVDPSCRSQGIGSKAMRLLLAYADEHSVTLSLYARSHSRSPLTSDRLARWYESLGFVSTLRGHVRKR